MDKKIILALKILVVASVALLAALVYFHQGDFTSLDLGRHLSNGKAVFKDTGVLFKNFYSYTEPNFPFINHHWLSGVIFYALYLLAGFKILTLLNLLLGVAAMLIIFKLAVKKSSLALAALLSLPVILLLSERIEVRPEMFSYFFIALFYYLLEDYRSTGRTKYLYSLPALILLWVNLHIYFFIGLCLIALTALDQAIKKQAAKRFYYIALASLAAAFINPNFYRAVIYPFNILKKYGYDIVENKSPFYLENLMINPNIAIFKLLLGFLIFSFLLLLFIRKKINFYDLIIAAAFSGFAMMAVRNLPLFGLMVLPIMAENFFESGLTLGKEGYEKAALITVMIIYLGTGAWLIRDNLNEKKFFSENLGLGIKAETLESINFYRRIGLKGPIFNNYDIGSALIFWLYPTERVFVDNRPEAYSIPFFQDIYKTMMQNEETWKKYSAQYKINLIYFSHTDTTPWAQAFLAARLRDPDWPLVYFDDYAIIFAKNDSANAAAIEKYKIDGTKFADRISELLKSADDREKIYLANLSVLYGRSDLVKRIYLDMLSARPDNGEVLAALGYLYAGGPKAEDSVKSLEYLNKAITNGYALPNVYDQMGLDYWKLNDYAEAKKMWQKALDINPDDETGKYYLNQANELIK